MTRFNRIIACLAVIALLPAAAFAAYREKDKKCMDECHGKTGLNYTPAGYWGNLRSGHVNYEAFIDSKHGVFACVDCHRDADAGEKTHIVRLGGIRCESCHSDEASYSAEIRELLNAKKIKLEDKKRVAADYRESVHGKAYYEKKKNAPYCTGCHNPHNANLKAVNSGVNRCDLPGTCGRCHDKEAGVSKGLFARLAAFRINGHKKGDASGDFSYGNCVDCHQGNAVHGKRVSKAACDACHQKRDSMLYAEFHGKNIPVLSILLNFGLVFGGIIAVGAVLTYIAGRNGGKKGNDEKQICDGH